MKKVIFYSFLAILLIPSLSFASFDVSLKYGSRGDAVSELQDFLTDQNIYTGKIDGKFGLGTVKAVKAFQSTNNLSADGYFGKGSRAVASSILAAELKTSDDAEMAETGTVTPASSTLPGCTSTTGFSSTTGHPCSGSTPTPVSDTGTQAAINSLTQTITQLQQQVAASQNASVSAPATVAAPISKKELKVENLTVSTDKGFHFKVSAFDDNGDLVLNPHPIFEMRSDESAQQIAYFGGASGVTGDVYFYPNHNDGQNITLTFSYKPLDLRSTLTVTAPSQ